MVDMYEMRREKGNIWSFCSKVLPVGQPPVVIYIILLPHVLPHSQNCPSLKSVSPLKPSIGCFFFCIQCLYLRIV